MKKSDTDGNLELPKFDVMVKMAKEDPKALEVLRQEMVDQLINEAPQQYHRKLRGLQFKIDMERERSKTPMASCIKLSKMMQESFLELRDTLRKAQQSHMHQLKQFSRSHAGTLDSNQNHSAPPVAHPKHNAKTTTRTADIIKFPLSEA